MISCPTAANNVRGEPDGNQKTDDNNRNRPTAAACSAFPIFWVPNRQKRSPASARSCVTTCDYLRAVFLSRGASKKGSAALGLLVHKVRQYSPPGTITHCTPSQISARPELRCSQICQANNPAKAVTRRTASPSCISASQFGRIQTVPKKTREIFPSLGRTPRRLRFLIRTHPKRHFFLLKIQNSQKSNPQDFRTTTTP